MTWDGLTPQTQQTDTCIFMFIQNSAKSQPMAPPHEAQESGPIHLTIGVTQLFLPTLQIPWMGSMLRSPHLGEVTHIPPSSCFGNLQSKEAKGGQRKTIRLVVNGDNKIWLSGFTNKVKEPVIATRGTERWERSEGQRWTSSVFHFSDLTGN